MTSITTMNAREYNEVVNTWKTAIRESMIALIGYKEEAAYILTYKDMDFETYRESIISELWDEHDNKLGEGFEVCGNAFILTEDNMCEVIKAYEMARDEAYEEYIADMEMSDLARVINSSEDFPVALVDAVIEAHDWTDDRGSQYGICHDEEWKLELDDNGEAVLN